MATIPLVNQTRRFIFAIAFFLTSCAPNANLTEATRTPLFFTATLAPTPTIQAASTQPVAPSPTAIVQPVEGITTSQLNVRSEPSTAGETLGTVSAFSNVQIIGKEANGVWYQIQYASGAHGTGWIAAKYVQVNPPDAPIASIDLGVSGIILQGVNVRDAPNKDAATLGTLVPDDVVMVSGKDSGGSWIQIQYKGSLGWVASEFIRVSSENLSVANMPSATEPVQTESAAGLSSNIFQDHDSPEAPSLSVQLDNFKTLQINGFISSINGDDADWLAFLPAGKSTLIKLNCPKNTLALDLYAGGKLISENYLSCQETKAFGTNANLAYTLKLKGGVETAAIPYSVFINNLFWY